MVTLTAEQLNKAKETVYKRDKLLRIAQMAWFLGMLSVVVLGVALKNGILISVGIISTLLGVYIYPKAKEGTKRELEIITHHLDNGSYLCEKYSEYTIEKQIDWVTDSENRSYNHYAYVETNYGKLQVSISKSNYDTLKKGKNILYLIWYDTLSKDIKGSMLDDRGKLQHPNMEFVNL